MSDASDISAPKDPAAYRPKPLLGATFWAMIALCVLCVLAGVAVASFRPRWLAPRPAPHVAGPATPESAQPAAAPVAGPSASALPAPEPASAPDVARLAARVGILE